ncbi:MAG: phosphate/phosphite/phosphonate ABC transporter substrate-binding protein [Gammaproteobacteria bacterium]|nr:phosphate/phosphite/phosphonate ABC transporter substrate-binding protein [Gammaproteobacteria bacterium]
MKNRNLFSFLVFLIIVFNCIEALAELKMGVFPRRSPEETQQAFQPLAEHLSKVLGEEVKLVVPRSFKEFWKGVKQNQFDLVHYNQYHYIRSHKEFGYRVIAANEEFGNKQIAGALSVRKDSGINTVADLRGKVILFGGGKKAMGSYIAPTALLKKAGLEAGKDYMVNYAINPPSAIVGAYTKGASAAGSGDVVLRLSATTKKINADDMKIIAQSEPFIQLPWAVNSKMPAQLADKIQKEMTSLKTTEQGRAILQSAEVTDFYAVSDKEFDQVRQITKFALGEEY